MKARQIICKFLGIVFAVTGIIFLVIGVLYISSWISFSKNAVRTEAVILITDYAGYPIKSKEPYRFYDQAIAMATYSVRDNIEDYTRELSGYAPGLYTGKKTTAYFHPDEPGRVGIFSAVVPAESIGIGILLLGCSTILFLQIGKKENKHEKAYKNER